MCPDLDRRHAWLRPADDGIGAAYTAGTAIAVVGGGITPLLSLMKLKIGNGLLGAMLNITRERRVGLSFSRIITILDIYYIV